MKSYLILLFFISIEFTAAQSVVIKRHCKEMLHYSYEDKFGDIVGVFMQDKTNLIQTGGVSRITFDFEYKLYPFILFPNDTLNATFFNRKPTYIGKLTKELNFYQNVDKNTGMIMNQFIGGIDYNSKVNFNLISEEIEKKKNERINYLKSQNFNRKYFDLYMMLIDFTYLSEKIAPFFVVENQKLIPNKIKIEVDKLIVDLENKYSKKKELFAIKDQVYLILSYKYLKQPLDLTFKNKVNLVKETYSFEMYNYISAKLINELKNNGFETNKITSNFLANCTDNDYHIYFSKKREGYKLKNDKALVQEKIGHYKNLNVNFEEVLNSYDGKNIIINFWASWCAPCIEKIPSIIKLEDKFKDKNIKVLYISLDEEIKDWESAVGKHFKGRLNLNHFRLLNEDSKIQQRFEAYEVPKMILVNKEGKVINFELPFEINQIEKILNKL